MATIETTLRDGWLTIWLARPESRNALSSEMVAELLSLLRSTAPDRSVRGITFRGQGDVFCAGGDLKGFQSDLDDPDAVAAIALSSRGAGELFHQINRMPQVVIMLVHGAAMAGGLGMVCAGDVVAVTRECRFALTETRLGIVPAQIAPLVINRIGPAKARRIMLTGARFKGDEAHALGIADFVADDDDGLDSIEANVRKDVMHCAPGAVAATKALLRESGRRESDAMIDAAANCFTERLLSDEGREGIASFIEKRQPDWSQ